MKLKAECIYLWNGNNQKSDLLLTAQDNICSLNWMNTNGVCLAIGMKDGSTELWDTIKMIRLRQLNGHSDRISSLSWNNHILSTGSKDSRIMNHDIRIPNHITQTLIGHTHEVCKVKWSPNGQYLASGGNDNRLCIWDLNLTNISNFNRDNNNVVLNYSNNNLSSLSNFNIRNPFNQRINNANFNLYSDLQNRNNIDTINNTSRLSNSNSNILNNNLIGNPNAPIEISNSSAFIYSNLNQRTNNSQPQNIGNLNLINNSNNLVIQNSNSRINNLNILNAHHENMNDINNNFNINTEFHSRGMVTNLNNTINQLTNNINLFSNSNNIFSIAENNSSEITASDNSFSPNLINTQSRIINPISPRLIISEHEAAVKALDWCPWQRNTLASGAGTRDKTIKFWDVESGRNLNTINTGSQVCNVCFNENEKELISSHGFSKNQISIWKYPSMSKVIELDGHMSRVLYMALSPDGSTIVSGAGDETLRFWKISENKKKDEKNLDDINSKFTSNILSSIQMR